MKGKTSHFFLFFVFCFSCFFSSVLSARELTKEEVEAVEIGVGQQLKDPYSAKYTHGSYMFEGRSGGVCIVGRLMRKILMVHTLETVCLQ